MREHSLIRRIVLTVIAVELLCAACFSGLALWHEWETRIHAVDAAVQGRSDSLLGAVQDAEDPADNVIVDPAEMQLPKEDFFAVYNEAGTLLGGSQHAAVPLTSRAGDGVRSMSTGGRSYRVLEREAMRIIDREENGGVGLRRPITIVYAIPTAHVWQEVREAANFYAAASLVLTGATAMLLVVLVRRLLQPIDNLAASASGISASTLHFQPPKEAVRVRELRPLAQALSEAMIRLRVAFQKEQRFVGDAAHELKTAVAVVRSSIQVLNLKPRVPEEYRQGLDAVLADNERVEELVSRMLILARAEDDPGFKKTLANLTEAVDLSIRELTNYAAAQRMEIKGTLAEPICARLPVDAARTLATNLIVNAIQHSHTDTVVLVRLAFSAAPDPQAVLEVQDFGEGIEAKDLPHVFDRFYRTDSSRSRATGGAGLGLAICKGIVDAAGGHIALESVVGQGTTARVLLPCVKAENTL